jgi:hypothetical protein
MSTLNTQKEATSKYEHKRTVFDKTNVGSELENRFQTYTSTLSLINQYLTKS